MGAQLFDGGGLRTRSAHTHAHTGTHPRMRTHARTHARTRIVRFISQIPPRTNAGKRYRQTMPLKRVKTVNNGLFYGRRYL